MTDGQKKILMEGAGLSKEEVESECVAKAFDFLVLENTKTMAIADKNRELLAQIEKLEEDDLVNSIKYENLIAQLLKVAGGRMTIPNPDLFAIRGEVRSTINADGSMTLKFCKLGEDDG